MTRGSTKSPASHFELSLPQSPQEYFNLLRFRWYWIAIALVIGATASQVAIRFVPKKYSSQTVVLVQSEVLPRKFIPQIATEDARDRLRTIQEEILARPRIERILDELNPYPELIDAPRANIVEMIQARTAVGLRGKDAFLVKYTDTDPQRAQQMASRLASLFIEQSSGQRAAQAMDANLFIEEQLDETRKDLERVESRLGDVKIRNMGMLPGQIQANLATLQRLQLERQSIGSEIRAESDRKGILERQLSLQMSMSEPEAQLIPMVPSGDTQTASEPSSLGQLRAYLAQLRTRYTDEHPEVQVTLARIAKLESQQSAGGASAEPDASDRDAGAGGVNASTAAGDTLTTDLRLQLAGVERNIENLNERRAETDQKIREYQARVERMPAVEQELQTLERDYTLISNYYAELLTRKLEAETAGAIEKQWQEQFSIIDPATVPERPDYPKPSLFLLMGTALGLGAGAAIAFLLEVVDPSVKSLRELESLLPYPVLLSLPPVKAKEPKRRRVRREPTPPVPPKPRESSKADGNLSAAS